MVRRSYMREAARHDSAGVPELAPPRTLFRRWGAVAPAPETESAPAARTTTARPNIAAVNRDFDSIVDLRASGDPRAFRDPIDAPDPVKFAPSKSAPSGPVAPAVTLARDAAPATAQTPERSAPSTRSIKPEVESLRSSFSTPPTGPYLFCAPGPGIPVPLAQQAAPTLHGRSASIIPAPAPPRLHDDPPARTRGDFPPSSPSPLRPAPNHQPDAPAHTVAMPIAPRERPPLTALPLAAESKAPSGPVIRIGSVEVHIVPPVPPVAAPIRPAAASPAAPLSREMISLFGLRQG